MNPAVKHVVERALVSFGVASIAARRIPAGSVLVLGYHNIVPDGESIAGDTSLHLPQREFARQLDILASDFDVVPLASIGAAYTSARRRVAITFDDAYSGALTAGIAELQKRSMAATAFVSPGLIEQQTWWDLLSSEDERCVPAQIRDHALWKLGGRGKDVLEWSEQRRVVAVPNRAIPRIASLAELESAAIAPQLTYGSHTWSHVNLSAVAEDELMRELTMPLEWLSARFANVMSALSYPYGHFTPAVESAALRAGYTSAFKTDGGWITGNIDNPMAIARFNVPAGLSTDGLRLRLAGLLNS